MNHKIVFPSVHTMGGKPFTAEVSAPSEALAIRKVLEQHAREGKPLEYVQIGNIQELLGAKLDGLKLEHCVLRNVALAGVSLTGAVFSGTTFDKVFADATTHMDSAIFDNVRFVDCAMDGMRARQAQFSGVRFETTSARGLDVEGGRFSGAKSFRSDLTRWKAHLCHLSSFDGALEVIEAADLTVNQKAAMRSLIATAGNRVAAEDYFNRLEKQSSI